MEKDNEKKDEDFKLLDKTTSFIVNTIYSKNKYFLYVLFLTFIGFIFRFLAALNLDVLADDTLYASQSAGIISSGILSTHSNPPLFFYLTDLIYKLFDYTTLASRFWPLIFGTLLIPLSFLIARKFFNEKIAFFCALFITFSNFLIKMTFTEQTLVVLFFSFFAVYLGMEYIDKEKSYFLYLSSIMFGLALLIKYSAPFFILSFLIFIPFYYKFKGKKFTKKHLKDFFIFFIILIILSAPFLVFNYLLYKDKGIVDVYFSRIVKLNSTQELYRGLAGQDTSFFENLSNKNSYMNLNLPFKTDILLAILSLFGLFLIFIRKQKYSVFFILIFLIIPFILQSAGSTLQKHFAFMIFILAFPASYGFSHILDKIKFDKKIILSVLIGLLLINLIFVTYGTPDNLISKSSTSQLKSYINKNVKDDDLIIFDSRIYTGKSFWLATDNHFLDISYFSSQFDQITSGSDKKQTNSYFIECYIDDCGWGTVKDNQALNQTMEQIFSSLDENNQGTDTIYERKTLVYRIYKIQTTISQSFLLDTDRINSFYFVPYLYKNKANYLFNYTIYAPIDKILSMLSKYIIFLSMILSLFSIYYLFKIFKSAELESKGY